MTRLLVPLFALLLALVHSSDAEAAPLRVGTKHAPPFAERDDDGR